MFEEKLKEMWQNASRTAQIRFEQSKLLIELKKQLPRFEQKIKYRNLTETIAAVLVIACFSWYIYIFSNPWITSGSIYLICYALFIIYRLNKTKKKQPAGNPGSDIKTYLQQYRDYLVQERSLVKNVLYWYLLPIIPGIVLFLLSGIYNLRSALTLIGGFLVIFMVSLYLNHRSKVKTIDPLIREVDETLEKLDEG